MEITAVALQTELERLYSKNQLIPRIRSEFMKLKDQGFDLIGYLNEREIPADFGVDVLIQMVLHKRATLPVLVGILQRHFDTAQECADMLLRMANTDLLDYSTTSHQFIVVADISEDVKEDLERFQYPLPMVIEPREIKTNRDSGYLLNNSSVILKDNHHEDDVCLDHLNRVNKIRFAINDDTATMVKNQWRNLDKPKEGETREDFNKRVKAFEKYDRSVQAVMAKLLSLGNSFYLTHRYDKRGRIYCQGYHVNYQGAPWNKAVIELADKEFIV